MGVGLLGMTEPHASASQTQASAARILREGITLLGRNSWTRPRTRFEQLLTAGLETPDACTTTLASYTSGVVTCQPR